MIDQLIQWDTDLFIYLNGLGSTSWDAFWNTVTNKLTSIPLYAILLYLIYRVLGWRGFLFMIPLIALMVLFTDQVTNLFKDGFQRPRPCRNQALDDVIRYVAVRCGKYGYFSGHAANSMAVAVFSGLLLRKSYAPLIFVLLFWSAVVSYSRIYVGVHYPLDVLSGMIFGACSGWLFFRIQLVLGRRFNF